MPKMSSSIAHFNFSNKVFRRRFIIRTVVAVLIIVLGIVMFFIGKNHVVHLSNMKTTIDGVEYKPVDNISVKFDKNKTFTSYADFSDEVSAVGSKHSLRVEYNGNVYEKKFKIPHSYRNVIISLPVFIKDTDNVDKWLTQINDVVVDDSSDEEMSETGEFDM